MGGACHFSKPGTSGLTVRDEGKTEPVSGPGPRSRLLAAASLAPGAGFKDTTTTMLPFLLAGAFAEDEAGGSAPHCGLKLFWWTWVAHFALKLQLCEAQRKLIKGYMVNFCHG